MVPSRSSVAVTLALVCGCGGNDTVESSGDPDGSSSSNSTASTTSTSTSVTGEPESSSGTDATSTAGQPACPADREPSGFTEVDGCGELVGEPFCSEGTAHIEESTPIAWESNPPHSGPHDPMWANWGEYDQTLPRRNWVHNLEHGGIVLSYVCSDGCEAEVDVLREVMAQRPDLRIILTPDPELPDVRFAAISWTWVYRFDSPDLDALLCFVDQHENHAPEDVP